MSDTINNKRSLSSDESNHSESENEGFWKIFKKTKSKRKKPNEERSSTFVSPEKAVDKSVCDFKTPEKVPFRPSSLEEKTPVKDRTDVMEKGSPSGWSLSSNLSVYIEGDEDDLISKMEQARRLISSTNSSPDRMNLTPKKSAFPMASPSKKLAASPITPGKVRRVDLITISSPKSKKKL